MQPLEPPDSRYLEAAKGWCQLHAFEDAKAELEKVAPQFHTHPLVLEVRWQVCANLDQWADALEIANAIVRQVPDWPNGWIYKASSLTELKRPQEAHQTIAEALPRFPAEEIIPYDVACLCCSLQRVEEARQWLKKAVEIGGNAVKQRALGDPDLAAVCERGI